MDRNHSFNRVVSIEANMGLKKRGRTASGEVSGVFIKGALPEKWFLFIHCLAVNKGAT